MGPGLRRDDSSRTPAIRGLPRVRWLLFSPGATEGKAMRRAVMLAILAASLAACGKGAGNGQNSAGGGLPSPGERPAPGPGATADAAGFRQRYREINIGTCVSGAESRSAQGTGAPPGSDFRGYCTCFIDGAMAGIPDDQLASLGAGSREQAIAEQCARERGLSTDFSSSGGR
jgi:hypothetical protein